MVIFSHRGIGFGQKENSLEALRNAVEKGFSVEVDIRFKKNNIILSHDEVMDDKGGTELNGLLKLIEGNPQVYFALHLKENSSVLFSIVWRSIKGLKNCIVFVTDFPQGGFINTMFNAFGSGMLALYTSDKNCALDLMDKVDYLWLDEMKDKIYDELKYFLGFNKKIICCSPELYSDKRKKGNGEFKRFLKKNHKKIFGICTDFCLVYEK